MNKIDEASSLIVPDLGSFRNSFAGHRNYIAIAVIITIAALILHRIIFTPSASEAAKDLYGCYQHGEDLVRINDKQLYFRKQKYSISSILYFKDTLGFNSGYNIFYVGGPEGLSISRTSDERGWNNFFEYESGRAYVSFSSPDLKKMVRFYKAECR